MPGGDDPIRTVNLYYTDGIELATLLPIGHSLAERGLTITPTEDLDKPADLGIYACHANIFFDFRVNRWSEPASRFSVICLHDLGQTAGGDDYFFRESWHRFDLGLLPGPRLESFWQQSARRGSLGPRLGTRVVGWPKFDHVHADPKQFAEMTSTLRSDLGLSEAKRTVLLACSWSDRQQLADTLSVIDRDDVNLVVKYPQFPPPSASTPWFDRWLAARAEMLRAKEVAEHTAGVFVADEHVDVYALVALADVVVSNGSNVLYEAVLMEKPGVSVRDWRHPSGPRGWDTTAPRVDVEGVVNAGVETLGEAVYAALRLPLGLRQGGSHSLVPSETRGSAGPLAAAAILEAIEFYGLAEPGADARTAPVAPPADPETAFLRAELERARQDFEVMRRDRDFVKEENQRLREELGRSAAGVLFLKQTWWSAMGHVAPEGTARRRVYLGLWSWIRRRPAQTGR